MTVDLHDAKKKVNQEELDRLAREEEEKLKKKAPENTGEEEEVEEEEGEEEEEEETEEEKAEREKKEKEEADKSKDKIDYEKKFKESTKEAMILKKQNEELLAEKNKKVVVDDAFLKSKYPDWDEMTTGEQRATRVAEEAKQELADINRKTNEFNNDKKWADKVDKFVEEEMADAFPKIKGREEEFKRFATRPTRKGLPLDDLAKIFQYEHPEEIKKKRNLFHAPGGEGKFPKKKEMTTEEISNLRKTDNKKYMELIRQKKIKVDLS